MRVLSVLGVSDAQLNSKEKLPSLSDFA